MEGRRPGVSCQSIRTCIVVLLAVQSLAGATAEPKPLVKTLKVPMQAHQNYFSERCMELEQDQDLAFSVESRYPVDFNIHHHTATSTDYPLRARVEDRLAGTVSLASAGEYCFMWKNPESRATDFIIWLSYTATAKASS